MTMRPISDDSKLLKTLSAWKTTTNMKWKLMFSQRQFVKILVIGLENHGKTTLLRSAIRKSKLKHINEKTIPTLGVSIETICKESTVFTCFDLSGSPKCRGIWSYFKGVNAAIIVIDRTDYARLSILKDIIQSQEIGGLLNNVPVCIFLSFSDKDGMDCAKLKRALDLDESGWNYSIFSANGVSGDGTDDGFKWLQLQCHK